MFRFFCTVIIVTSVMSCARENGESAEATQPGTEWPAQTDISAMSGASAYRLACASCHDTGANGAPLTGDPDAWSDRSQLWQAVLADHANKGYMEMPAKGGKFELPDQVVTRAVEYMMLLTYPGRPPD